MELPRSVLTVETLATKQEAIDTVDMLIKRNMELEQIHEMLQPLLYALSVRLYADNDEPVSLSKLIEDAVLWINPSETIQ